ncbi:MAG: peptide ABC transporter substrate-binding protein [Armatimonadetes bacterium]|nr:peptide ABC transporter substrate-binding protein [Armatimonadota bacterium]
MRNGIRLLLLAVLVAALGATLVNAAPAPSEQVFRYPFREPDQAIDPTKGATLFNGHYMANLFEGLAEAGLDGKITMLGATAHKVSDDRRTYTFTLRKDIKWSDGTAVTAHDYVFSYQRALDPKTANINVSSLVELKNGKAFNGGQLKDPNQLGVKALDDYTLQITLEGPAGWFLRAIAVDTAWFPVPRHAVTRHGEKWTEAENIVANGPFTIQSWRHDQQMVLVPNPQYWRDKPVVRVLITMTNDPSSTSLPAYETGEVDWAWAPLTQLNQLRQHPVLSKELKFATQTATWFTVFDVTTPPFSDARVRRAFYVTLDRQRLTQGFLQGAYRPAASLIPPGQPGHTDKLPMAGGVQEGRRLMAEAGFPDGRGFPTVTYTTPNLAEDRVVAEALQQMWKQALNVNLQIELLERRAFQSWRAARRTQPYHLHYGGWTGLSGDPVEFHNGMLSSVVDRQNHKWRNGRYEEWIGRGAMELDVQKRADFYQRAEQIVAQDVPVIPWGYKVKPYLIKPHVRGFETGLNGYIDLFRKIRIVR